MRSACALRGVVAPQLHVGVRAVREAGHLVQRGAVGLDGHHRAGREVGGDADDGGRVDPGVSDRGGDSVPEHVPVVVGHLQGPFPGKAGGCSICCACHIRGERFGDHGVRVVEHAAAELLAVPDPHNHGPAGQGAVVHADDIVFAAVCCDVHESSK